MLEALAVVTGEAPPPPLEAIEIAASEFITGAALAAAVGLTAGTLMNSNTNWIKIVNNVTGSVTIIPKMPIRHSMSKNNLIAATPSNGSKIVSIAGESYRVRLMTGATVNPTPTPYPGREGGEYNSLIYAVCNGRPSNWAGEKLAEFTPAQMGFQQSLGCWTPVVEANGPNSIFRGSQTDLKAIAAGSATGASTLYGWRPILIKV